MSRAGDWDDDVDVVYRTKAEKELPVVDWDNSEAAAMKAAQDAWRPIHERLTKEFDAEPDLNKRNVLAKLIMDVAMASKNPAIVGKQLAQLCKIYGHETTTVKHEAGTVDLEKRLDLWLSEAKQKALPPAPQSENVIITILEPNKERVGGDL